MTINLKIISQAVAANLQSLVDADVLKSYTVDEGALNILTMNIPKDPCAVLLPPAIESGVFDTSNENQMIMRFDIPILRYGTQSTDQYSTADLMGKILDQFNSDPTLKGGGATGTVVDQYQPATVEHFTVNNVDKTLIVFVLTLKYYVIAAWR